MSKLPLDPVRGLLATLLLTLAGAAAAQFDDTQVLMTGPAGPLTAAEVKTAVADLVPAEERPLFWGNASTVTRFVRSLYAQRVLARQAQASGADQSPEAQRYLKLVQERALSEVTLRMVGLEDVPDAAALQAYAHSEYKAQPERFTTPDQVHARHILLRVADNGSDDAAVKARAEELLARIQGGADFAQLASELSDDKGSGARGGDLGTFAKGKMVQEFEDAAFALQAPGALAGPVKTRFGYHLIQLVERVPGQLRPFEDVLPQLSAEVLKKQDSERRARLWREAEAKGGDVDAAVVQALAAERLSDGSGIVRQP